MPQRAARLARFVPFGVAAAVAASLLFASPAARAQGGCTTAPIITPSSTAPVDVPIGAGSAIPPNLTVTCDGAPVPDASVDVSIAGPVGFNGEYFIKGDVGDITADANGVIALPIVTSETTAGPFTITASGESATATIPGKVTGTLAGDPPPPQNPILNETVATNVENCRARSATCPELAQYNGFRRHEHLGPLILPGNWSSLTIPQQLFALTQLERTARGLPPESGLASDWDRVAQHGANAGEDPTGTATVTSYRQASPWEGNNFDPSGSYTSPGLASTWYGGADPLAGFMLWMYQDGLSRNGTSNNLDCHPGDRSGCWGHRDIILNTEPFLACQLVCAIGAATAPASSSSPGGDTEAFPSAGDNADPLVFTWFSELAHLPACERAGDSCSWNGQPIVTSAPLRGKRLAVKVSKIHRSHDRITFTVRFTEGRGRIQVTGILGRQTVKLTNIRRTSRATFHVTARLRPGRWKLTISIRPARGYRSHGRIVRQLTIPG
ncbi:MAG: hypothetical protein ACRDL5_17995 [Solirubrobacteraceae bacterium]